MNKKFFNRILMGVLFVASAISFGSCEDWEGEINNLQGQIDEIEASLEKIQELIDGGVVITDVKSTEEGVSLVMSDGNSYLIKNGENGENGADAVVWEIGTDGFWYKDGVKTDFVAVGKDGADGKDGANGADGKDGQNGTNGKDGQNGTDADIWTPGTDGFWYKNGDKQADFSWRAQGVTALVDGNVLKLYGIGEEFGDSAFIELGAQLGSVAFEAEVYSTSLPLPTHKADFLHVGNLVYATAAPFERLETSTDWYGNTIQLPYRLNPEDAFIGKGLIAQFVSVNAGKVTTRGNVEYLAQQFADIETLQLEEGDGRFVVDAKLLAPELTEVADVENLIPVHENGFGGLTAALMVNQGTHAVLSDYIRVASKDIKVDIVTNATVTVKQTERDVELPAKPEDEYVTCVKDLTLAAPLEVSRAEKEVDLNQKYILAESGTTTTAGDLENHGFAYTLKFTLVGTKAVGSTDQTEQEYYVTLGENGMLYINDLASVVGKTPIIRIDAYIENNLVESAYAQIKLTDKDAEPEVEDTDHRVVLKTENEIKYSSLSSAWTLVDTLDWKTATAKIYNELDITTADFWTLYNFDGIVASVYTVPAGETDSINVLDAAYADMAKAVVYDNTDRAGERNLTVGVSINNLIWTDKSWARDGKYGVKIVIPRNNRNNIGKKRDVIIIAEFNVVQDGKGYTLRKYNAVNNVVTAMPTVKDLLVDNHLATYIAQHFVNKAEFDLFNTFAQYNEALGGSYLNVEKADFRYVPLKDEVEARAKIQDNAVVLLETLKDQAGVLLDVEYDMIYVNNDTLTCDYDVEFVTPFRASVAKADTIFLNTYAGKVDLSRLVNVVTKVGNKSLYVSNWTDDPLVKDLAEDWAIAKYELKFDFDMEDQETKTVCEELLATESSLEIDRTESNGKMGGNLVYDYNGNTEFKFDHTIKLKGELKFLNAGNHVLYSFDVPVSVVLSKELK